MVTYLDAATAPLRNTGQIRLYDAEAFEGMRKACQLTARCLDELAERVKPGVTTDAIDRFVFEFGMDHGALPATLNYRGYTKSSCTSINHVVCHGIPDQKPLKEGDVVNIDVTYILDGWHGNSSRMYPVGVIKRAAERLLEVTYECLMRGVAAVKPGSRTGAIGAAIQAYAENERCSVVRDFCGHGVGRLFHDAPNILHYGSAGEGVEMRAGHDLHHRADDQSRPAACEGAVRRLDGRHPRPLAVGAVRAHGGRHLDRLRNLHAVAERARPARPDLHRYFRRMRDACPAPDLRAVRRWRGRTRTSDAFSPSSAGAHLRKARAPRRKSRIISGIATAARALSCGRRGVAWPITNCSNCCSSARSRGPTRSRSPRRCSSAFRLAGGGARRAGSR